MAELTKSKRLKFVLRMRPVSYVRTKPQERMKKALEVCGIQKGITRGELVDKMVNCIPRYWAMIKEQKKEAE